MNASQAPAACRPRAPAQYGALVPRGRLWPSRHDRPCLHACGHRAMIAPASSLCVACPRRRALRMSSRPSDIVRCNLSPTGAFGQDDRHGAHLDGHPIGRDVLERARHEQWQTWVALPALRAQRIGRFFRAGDRQQYQMAAAACSLRRATARVSHLWPRRPLSPPPQRDARLRRARSGR